MAKAAGNARFARLTEPARAVSRRSVLAGSAAVALAAATPACATAESAVPPALIAALATGFNLPNVCDLPPAAAELPGKSLLHDLNALGFRHIRLPIDPTNCVRAERAFVRCLDAVIDRILGAGFALSLDIHAGEEAGAALREEPSRGGDLIASALRFVAERANDLPTDRVAIELLNEPPLETADWRPLRQRLVREVRAQAPRHTLIWSASRNQTIEETIDDPGPGDRNAVAAVHYYYPMVFTHQGQTWGSTPFAAIKALPFPFSATDVRVGDIRAKLIAEGRADSLAEFDAATEQPWNEERIARDFSALRAWSERTRWPVILNEFGVYREFAPKAGRLNWLASVRRAAEQNGFGWCHWEFDKGFGFTSSRTDPGEIDPDIVAALLGGG